MKKIEKIKYDIITGKDPYYCLSHFAPSNMQDYGIMSDTIKDMAIVYNISEFEAIELVETLSYINLKQLEKIS